MTGIRFTPDPANPARTHERNEIRAQAREYLYDLAGSQVSVGAGTTVEVSLDIVEGVWDIDNPTGGYDPRDHTQQVALTAVCTDEAGTRHHSDSRFWFPLAEDAPWDEYDAEVFGRLYDELVAYVDAWLTEHDLPVTEAVTGLRVATPVILAERFAS